MNYYELSMGTNPLSGLIVALLVPLLIAGAIAILMCVSLWKIFQKANRTPWESLVPGHNIFVLMEISGTPTWHVFLTFIPWVNIYVLFRVSIDLAHKFGKSTGFGVATAFFSVVCLPIIAFSKDIQYNAKMPMTSNTTNDNVMPPNNNAGASTMNQSVNVGMPIYAETQTNVANINTAPTQNVVPEPTNNVINTNPTNNVILTPPESTNNMENIVPVPQVMPDPVQPQNIEPTPIVPTQPVVPEPTVPETFIDPTQNNNQNGQMM